MLCQFIKRFDKAPVSLRLGVHNHGHSHRLFFKQSLVVWVTNSGFFLANHIFQEPCKCEFPLETSCIKNDDLVTCRTQRGQEVGKPESSTPRVSKQSPSKADLAKNVHADIRVPLRLKSNSKLKDPRSKMISLFRPHLWGGGGEKLYTQMGFFCSVNFGRSIYSS